MRVNKYKRENLIDKYKEILIIISLLGNSYCMLQTQLFDAVKKFNLKSYDGHNKVYRNYTIDSFNRAIRELESNGFLGRFITPLPNGTYSKYMMIYLKKPAVAYLINKDIADIGSIRKPTTNITYTKSIIKAYLLLNNKSYNDLHSVYNNEFVTYLGDNNKILRIYDFFIKNNINKNDNINMKNQIEKSLSHLKEKGKKEDKNNKNIFTLRHYQHIYIDGFFLKNNTLHFRVLITNPSDNKTPMRYLQDVIDVNNVLFEIINDSSVFSTYDLKHNIEIDIVILFNSESDSDRFKSFYNSKKSEPLRKSLNQIKQTGKRNFTLKSHVFNIVKKYGRFTNS